MTNAKNQLSEIVQNLGYRASTIAYARALNDGAWTSTATLSLGSGATLSSTGTASKATDAELAAAAEMVEAILRAHPELLVDWATLYVEAQAGDALIKVAVYSAPGPSTAEERSRFLQNFESDAHLCEIYLQRRAAGDARALRFGPDLSQKKMATLVEAWLWQDYSGAALAAGSREALDSVIGALNSRA